MGKQVEDGEGSGKTLGVPDDEEPGVEIDVEVEEREGDVSVPTPMDVEEQEKQDEVTSVPHDPNEANQEVIMEGDEHVDLGTPSTPGLVAATVFEPISESVEVEDTMSVQTDTPTESSFTPTASSSHTPIRVDSPPPIIPAPTFSPPKTRRKSTASVTSQPADPSSPITLSPTTLPKRVRKQPTKYTPTSPPSSTIPKRRLSISTSAPPSPKRPTKPPKTSPSKFRKAISNPASGTVTPARGSSPPGESGSVGGGGSSGGKKCSYCKTENTPMWRKGPGGPKTLCNACGVKYMLGKLVIGVGDVDIGLCEQ